MKDASAPSHHRLTIAGMLLATTLFIAAPAAPARARCTVKGTSGDDHLVDTAGASRICALGGNDIVEAGPWNDVVLGGRGSDHLEGNEGKDVVKGGRGADTIVVADGAAGDRAVGGPGKDTCYVDRGDRTRGCETETVVG